MKAIKKILAFTMVLTMLLGCFMFSTSAADAEGAPTDAPGAGTGDIKYYGTCTKDGQENQQFFVVRDDNEGNVTMYIYGDGTNKGWFRPLSNTEHWGETNLGAEGVAWCATNVTKVVIDSGVTALAAEAFKNYTALRYVEINPKDISATDLFQRSNLFNGCILTAVYQTGRTPIDGVADLTMLTKFGRGFDEDTALNGMSGINTVLFSEQVEFTNPKIFSGMPSLTTVIIPATDASLVTASGKISAETGGDVLGPVVVPNKLNSEEKIDILCSSDAVKEAMVAELFVSADDITVGEIVLIDGEISTKTDCTVAGAAGFKVVQEGNEKVMYLDAMDGNDDVSLWSFEAGEGAWPTEVVNYLPFFKTDVTKAVIGSKVGKVGYGLFSDFKALTTVEIAAESLMMDRGNTFNGCSALTSVYKTGETPEAGVADLTMVTKLGQGGWGEMSEFWGVTRITTVKLGDEICFGGTNPIAGSTGITKITISATDAEKITSEGLNANWTLTLPDGAVFECANEAIKNRLVEVTFIDAAKVTFPAPEPTPDENTGNENTGDGNTGNENTGDGNTGNENTGDGNTGNENTGDGNTGNENTGNQNTGAEDNGGDETTKAPETEAPETETPATDNKSGGCGSTVTVGALAVVAIVGACVTAVRKKED